MIPAQYLSCCFILKLDRLERLGSKTLIALCLFDVLTWESYQLVSLNILFVFLCANTMLNFNKTKKCIYNYNIVNFIFLLNNSVPFFSNRPLTFSWDAPGVPFQEHPLFHFLSWSSSVIVHWESFNKSKLLATFQLSQFFSAWLIGKCLLD